jgi:hypothetical protein
MSYNPFRWFTKGRPKKPLKEDAPLLLKIRNGDFEYSYMFNEAEGVKAEAQRAYDLTYNNYKGNDEKNRIYEALEAGRMKRIKAVKLMLEAGSQEQKILWKLQGELKKEFEKDLWDKAMNLKCGFKTIEDLYFWYKKQIKEQTTKSEMDIQLKRANTKGLQRLF